jgi:hypothetical protein
MAITPFLSVSRVLSFLAQCALQLKLDVGLIAPIVISIDVEPHGRKSESKVRNLPLDSIETASKEN